MKKILMIAAILICLVSIPAMAQEKCYSSGLLNADTLIPGGSMCLCGIEVIPAAADVTLTVYSGTGTSGTVIAYAKALANTVPGGFPPVSCIPASGGIYNDVSGAGATFIIWWR